LLFRIAHRDTAAVELHQLAYFVAVAEELSFTRGAARVHVVQSAVSAAIGRLERELGGALFDRAGRRIALTATPARPCFRRRGRRSPRPRLPVTSWTRCTGACAAW
jgi:DNA-binding transcriptional LysR family regulator